MGVTWGVQAVVELNRMNGIKGSCLWVLDMLDHRRLFEVPTTRLGHEQGFWDVTEVSDTCTVTAVCLFVLANFVLFVFACIALTHSDNDLIKTACDGTLRIFVMVDMVAFFAGVFLCGCSYCIPSCDNKSRDFVMTLSIFIFIATFGLSLITFMASDQAMKNPDCVSVMRSTVDPVSSHPADRYNPVKGLDSPSANTDWPLLAVSGFYYGVFYACLALVFLYIGVSECRKKQ